MPRSSASILPALLAAWRQRLARFRTQLHDSPTHEDAWYWTMQCRVMKFLLGRYDRVATDQYATSKIMPTDEPPEHAVPSELTFHSSRSLAAMAFTVAPPRASRSVGPIVERITQSNESRYERLQRAREEEIALSQRIADRQRFEVEWLREHLALFDVEMPATGADVGEQNADLDRERNAKV